MASESYLGNPLLRTANKPVEYTPEQVEEYMKCADDPFYFIEKYIKIVNVDRGLIPIELYDFQKKIIKTVHENRFSICKIPRQAGKCVYKDTYIRIRNKKTGEIRSISIGEFYERIKNQTMQELSKEL